MFSRLLPRRAAHPAPLHGARAPRPKVFGIGANKTGTSTLMEILRRLGLREGPLAEGERCAEAAFRGDLAPLARLIRRYDAFKDVPFSVRSVYAQVDALFPRSKFILTVREPEAWFRSISTFHARLMGVDDPARVTPALVRACAYGGPGYWPRYQEATWLLRVDGSHQAAPDWNLLYDRDHYIDLYVKRNQEIVRHFSERPDDLLIVDLTRARTPARIADFLGYPRARAGEMPWENPT